MKLRLMQCSLLSPVPTARPCLSFKTKPKCFSSSLEYRPWSGLQTWRESPVNEDRRWGPNGPEPLLLQSEPSSTADAYDFAMVSSASSLAELGALVLSTSDPLTKSRLSHFAYSRWRLENLPLGFAQPPSQPARPSKPDLVRSLFIFLLNQILRSFWLIGFLSCWEIREETI